MEPVTALIALALFTWGVAIWATYGGESQSEIEGEDLGKKPEKKSQVSSDIPKAA